MSSLTFHDTSLPKEAVKYTVQFVETVAPDPLDVIFI